MERFGAAIKAFNLAPIELVQKPMFVRHNQGGQVIIERFLLGERLRLGESSAPPARVSAAWPLLEQVQCGAWQRSFGDTALGDAHGLFLYLANVNAAFAQVNFEL